MIVGMAHPFDSARRKVARAKEHIATLEGEVAAFFAGKPYSRVAEPDPKQPHLEVHKLRFTGDLPDQFATMTSDGPHNLRDALDNAGYALAVASGKTSPLNAAFPFAGSSADFKNSLGRCKDIPEALQRGLLLLFSESQAEQSAIASQISILLQPDNVMAGFGRLSRRQSLVLLIRQRASSRQRDRAQ